MVALRQSKEQLEARLMKVSPRHYPPALYRFRRATTSHHLPHFHKEISHYIQARKLCNNASLIYQAHGSRSISVEFSTSSTLVAPNSPDSDSFQATCCLHHPKSGDPRVLSSGSQSTSRVTDQRCISRSLPKNTRIC